MKLGRGVLLVICLIAACAGAALAATPGLYASRAPNRRAQRWMEIKLQVLTGGQRVNWWFEATAPCTSPGTSLGDDEQSGPGARPVPPARLVHGRFLVSHHGVDVVYWSFTLQGHVTPYGFAGTLRDTQHTVKGRHPAVRCDTGVMRWTARRSGGSFP